MPKLSDKILLGEMSIDKYITHTFEGLEKIQEFVDTHKSGNCLKAVLKISQYEMPKTLDIKVTKSDKTFGGAIKEVRHWSECN